MMSSSTLSLATPFALSRLWRDQRVRGVVIQIIAFAALFGLVVYMGYNAKVNLAALGKELGFDFLEQPANYDINQTLIEYNSLSSHWRAMFVGILNTVLVAIAGIILTTILGFALGILRLSHNYLVSKLAYVYIEYVRNVPILLHILLVHGIIVHSLPLPRNAHGFQDIAFLTNRGLFFPQPSLQPLFYGVIALFVIGIGFSVWFTRYARQVQDATGKRYPVFWINLGAILGVPLLAFLLLGLPISWEIPQLRGFNFVGGWVMRPEFIALWLALSLYTAAFIGEIVRAGIIAVSSGQSEASLALGLTRGQTLKLIVVPQALRVIVPPLTSQYLNITKNSSLAIAIGYMDIVATIGGISLNQTGREMECMIIVLFLYLTLSLLISSVMNWYNRRIQLAER